MKDVKPEILESIRCGVDQMSEKRRLDIVLGLGKIVSLVPECTLVQKEYSGIYTDFTDPELYIDQQAINLGGRACLELSLEHGSSEPLGTYLQRFNENGAFGYVPRRLAMITVVAEHAKALRGENEEGVTRAEKILTIATSADSIALCDKPILRISQGFAHYRVNRAKK